MKNLILGLILLSTSAFGGELLVKEFSEYELSGSRSLSAVFEVNEELNRAWVKATIVSTGEEMNEVERVKVAGLSYDSATKSINLDHEGALVECAKLKINGRGIFRTVTVRQTKNCSFVQRWRNGSYDNGFEIVKFSKLQLILKTK